LLAEFLNNFEGVKGNKDGIVTKEEFIDYYTDLSMSIPNDDYFIELIESVWMIVEKEEGAAFKETMTQLTTKIYTKLRELAQPLDDKMLGKMFKEFNKSKSGSITIDELAFVLVRLGVSAERKYLVELFKKFDLDKSGTIEPGEFATFIKASAPQ
jgi:Ca2+-binding EF-hand superfamily protein